MDYLFLAAPVAFVVGCVLVITSISMRVAAKEGESIGDCIVIVVGTVVGTMLMFLLLSFGLPVVVGRLGGGSFDMLHELEYAVAAFGFSPLIVGAGALRWTQGRVRWLKSSAADD